MEILINSYPRIHISLLDMTAAGYRLFGGIGFAIDALPIELVTRASSTLDINSLASAGYSAGEISKISERLHAISKKGNFFKKFFLESITKHARHSGLGTGTQLMLSLTEALLALNGTTNRETIQEFSGRGGASGVGIQTYFDGGLVLDIGRPRRGVAPVFLPSNCAGQMNERPYAIGRIGQVPWLCGIFVPNDVPPIDAATERSFFERFTPAPPAEVHQTVYDAIFGIYGGAASLDAPSFSAAINSIQQLHWKRNEIHLHGGSITRYMSELRDMGASAVGMSSFGPCLYYFGGETESIANRLHNKYPGTISICTTIRQTGRIFHVR